MLKKLPYVVYTSILIAGLLFFGCAEVRPKAETTPTSTSRHPFLVVNTSADACLEILGELGLGQASKRLPNMLEVSGSVESLQRVAIVMRLIDSRTPYGVETLGTVAMVRSMPANEQIARRLDGVSIGTFARPPQETGMGIIIDLLDDRVIAIAPRHLIEPLTRAVTVVASDPMHTPPNPASPDEDLGTPQVPESVTASEHRHPSVVSTPHPPREDATVVEVAVAKDPVGDEGIPTSRETTLQPNEARAQDTAPTTTVIRAAAKPEVTNHRRPFRPTPFENGDALVELTLPEAIGLIELLDLVGEYLDLDYLYDPGQVKDQPLSLKLHGKLQGDLRVKDLYALLETVLKFKGLAMTRGRDELVAIVPLAEALEIDPALVDPNSEGLAPGDLVVTRVFDLVHIDPAQASKLLEQMKLGVAMTPVPETRTLFVTCYAHRLERIESLISLIDQAGEARLLVVRTLNHTTAGTIAEKVRILAQELDGMSVTLAVPAKGARAAGQGKPVQVGKQAVFLDTDERTNRLLMIGLETQLTLVQQLIDTLDVPQQDLRGLQVYAIQFAQAREVVAQLTTLGVMGNAAAGSDSRSKSPSADARVAASQVVLLETTNSLLISATQEQHERIEQILGYIDVSPVDQRTSQVYAIQHVDAMEVAAKLQDLRLVGTSPGASVATARVSAAKTASAAAGSTGAAPGDETQLVILEARNALLIHAEDEVHQRIQRIIELADVRPSEQAIPYEIYFLENQAPEQLAQILSTIVQETLLNDEGKVEAVRPRTEDQVIIVPDPSTFSLIVYATRKNQEWISKLITNLDKRRPQVLIDVTLVEIRKTDEFNYDLNLIQSFPDLVETGGQTGSFLVDGQTVVDKLREPGMRRRFVDFQSNSGLGTGFYADEHINVLLTAMESKNYGRVLAKPKILVNDNEAGTIRTTDTTYVTKKSSIPVASGAAGQQSTLVETAIDYEGYDAGITLDITPHTSESPLLRLDITLTRSDFGNITGEAPPDTSSSDLTTIVTVPDGSTIILGGMLRLNQSKGSTKVPLLGDLPLVGALFRGLSNTDIQNKLYIFVRAEIIRPEDTLAALQDDLQRISDENRKAFEAHEREFQAYQNWPGVPAKPTQPEKVLDAQ